MNDLVVWPVPAIEAAINDWRRNGHAFCPTSGQLIEIMRKAGAERREREAWRALPEPERKSPRDLKPWRQVLIDNGRDPKSMPEAIAKALDELKKPAEPSAGHP